MPVIVKRKTTFKVPNPSEVVENDLSRAIGGCQRAENEESLEREERLAIMTIDGGLSEEEAVKLLTETGKIMQADQPVEQQSSNPKIKEWNPGSEMAYLEFWVGGELVGASHVPPEQEAEVTRRFYNKYGVVSGLIRERMTDAKRKLLFGGRL